MNAPWKIISVGGSIVIPKTGFDVRFLKQFVRLIENHITRGNRLILVVGGGWTCRQCQDAAKKVALLGHDDLDWIGIASTVLNAKFLQLLLKQYADPRIIQKPKKKIITSYPVFIGAGFEPGHSTDMDAVLLAKTYGAKEIINLSNIDYVYDKDPKKYKNAKKIEHIDWKTFREDIVGNEWRPGKNAPFDPIASQAAEKIGLTVRILRGTNLKQLKNVLGGEQFLGTEIHP